MPVHTEEGADHADDAEAAEQLSADLQKLEQGVNSDKESDRRVMLAQLDKPH